MTKSPQRKSDSLGALDGLMSRVDGRKKRAPPKLLMTENRFNAADGGNLSLQAVRFGAAMTTYLTRWKCQGFTGGQVCDVLLSLGYANQLEAEFEICVHRMTIAIVTLTRGGRRKNRRRFPTCSEILHIAMRLGWYLRPEKKVL